ncbi:MAG: hypothetical protein ACRDVP_00740 [Acidimicrobiales bacterium]
MAVAKERRVVELVDMCCFARPVVLVWRKRRFVCQDPDCCQRSLTETATQIAYSRKSMTDRVGRSMTYQIGKFARSIDEVAEEHDCDWHTVNAAVRATGVPSSTIPAVATLRPGNAGANTVADHLNVLEAAIAQLPEEVRSGHHADEDTDLVTRDVVVLADSGGCSEGLLSACRARNVGFFASARSNAQVTAASFDAMGIEEVWLPALDQEGEPRDDAHVAELTSLIEVAQLPAGTRLIVRREPLHPGVRRSLFPCLDYRYWGFYTDQGGDPAST